jgi:hypothetical protein
MRTREINLTDYRPLYDVAGKDPEVFYERESYVIEDDKGAALYVMFTTVKRVDIVFAEQNTLRAGRAMCELKRFTEAQQAKQGFKEVIFDSVAEPLIAVMKKWGFKKESDTLVKRF